MKTHLDDQFNSSPSKNIYIGEGSNEKQILVNFMLHFRLFFLICQFPFLKRVVSYSKIFIIILFMFYLCSKRHIEQKKFKDKSKHTETKSKNKKLCIVFENVQNCIYFLQFNQT